VLVSPTFDLSTHANLSFGLNDVFSWGIATLIKVLNAFISHGSYLPSVPCGTGTPTYRFNPRTKIEQTTLSQHAVTGRGGELPCTPLGSDLPSLGPGLGEACCCTNPMPLGGQARFDGATCLLLTPHRWGQQVESCDTHAATCSWLAG
jgi:hypothetical protein